MTTEKKVALTIHLSPSVHRWIAAKAKENGARNAESMIALMLLMAYKRDVA